MGTVIVITSGKGGTGKTSLTGGAASCLAALGRRVLCIDLDIGLRNLDISLGNVPPPNNFCSYLRILLDNHFDDHKQNNLFVCIACRSILL